MSSNDITIGEVFFKESEGTHFYRYSIEKTDKNIDDYDSSIRTRCAYIIVTEEESEKVNKDEKDKEKILNKVKDVYSEYLTQAIKKESENLTKDDLTALSKINIDKKIVNLTSLRLYNANSYGSVLKAKGYTHAYNQKLEDSLKQNDETKSIGTLVFNKDSCQKIINEEQIINLEKENAYIIVSIPYVYNVKDNSKIKELEVTIYKQNITASYMPEVIVEYGVFFDGTNNNIYNINFYRNYVEFLEEPAKYIEENKNFLFEPKPLQKIITIQEYIVSEPNPKMNDEVLLLLISQIDKAKKEIRYFDEDSNLEIEEKELLQSLKANHAKKVFEYFVEVKKELNTSEEKNREEYIRENILVDDSENSSFVNGETNISRLYNLYNGADIKRDKTILSTTRFKLYESGAGTNNPFIQKGYKEDSILFGSGLGGEKFLTKDKTGIEAHIIYACIKIAQQLRTASNISYINELYFDVFGFSRGAATARHFICSILNSSEKNANGYSIKMKKGENIFTPFFGSNGIVSIDGKRYYNPLNTQKKYYGAGRSRIKNPYYKEKKISIESISFRFVGIYDTVSHVGIKQANDFENLNLDFFKDGNDKKIGQVVHLMASDEFRYNFDAYSIFIDKNKELQKTDGTTLSGGKKFEEYFVPGAHSDVGGGYNTSSETTLLTKRYVKDYGEIPIKLKNILIAWNKKYNWLNTSKIKKVKLKNEIKKDNEDGFYYCILPEVIPTYLGASLPRPMLYLYMHKKEVVNKYEQITLKIMYERAIYKDMTKGKHLGKKEGLEVVPFGSFSSYSFKRDDFLTDIYKVLEVKGDFKNDDEKYKRLKNDYIHHSAKYANFVNKASFENKDKNDFYGKRVIYTAIGDKFTRV